LVSRPDTIALYSQACGFLQQGAVAQAAGLFRQAVQLEPGSVQARYNLGCCLMQTGDLMGAADSFRQCAERQPGHADALFNLGCVLRELGQIEQAAQAFALGLEHNPDDRECAFNLAATLKDAGDVTGAIAAYRNCVARHPQFEEALFNLGSLLSGSGDYDEAASLLADLHRRNPGDEKVTQNLARAAWLQRLEAAAADQAAYPRLLVACMPKSGSTFLTDLIAKLPGMQRVHLVPEYGRREQEFDLEQLVIHRDIGFVSQLHVRPSEFTLGLCRKFGIRPIFLYRNI
jgi:Flp pilus assembly protein TadD